MRLRNLLRKNNITPDLIKLDQCFMINPEVIRFIIKSAELNKNDIVCEIGAGTGILTGRISDYVKKVYAIELDNRLYDILSAMLTKKRNVDIVMGDVKKYGFFDANKIVTNLPYSITDWFFKEINKNKNIELVIATIPLKFFNNQVKNYKNLIVEKIKTLNYDVFYPQPKIKSCVVKIIRKN